MVDDAVGRGVRSRVEAQHAGVVAGVGIPAQNPLVQPGTLAARTVAPALGVDINEFKFLFRQLLLFSHWLVTSIALWVWVGSSVEAPLRAWPSGVRAQSSVGA